MAEITRHFVKITFIIIINYFFLICQFVQLSNTISDHKILIYYKNGDIWFIFQYNYYTFPDSYLVCPKKIF